MHMLTARLLGALTLTIAFANHAAANPPAEAFGSLPQFSDWKLSPDAKHLAVLQPQNGKDVVLIYAVGAPAGTKPVAFGSGDGIIRQIMWLNDDRLAVGMTKNMHMINDRVAREWEVFVSIDADAQNLTTIEGLPIGVDLSDPDHAYAQLVMETDHANATGELTSSNKSDLGLYQVGTEHTTLSPVEVGTNDTVQWVIDEHGRPVARVDEDAAHNDDVFTRQNGGWMKVASFAYGRGEHVGAVDGELADSATLAVRRYDTGSTDELVRVDLSGKEKDTLFHDPTYDFDDVLSDEWTNRVIGVSWVADKREYLYFDTSREALQKGLEQAFPGNSVAIVSMDETGNTAIVGVDGPRQPPAYLFYDRTTKHASVIANAYSGLTPNDLGAITPYQYKARDGLDIHAYLTLPPGVTTPKNMPLVVFPHGGPEARDSMDFDWWAQFMANRGYLVFQPNFRGSTGYGMAFHDAGDGQWGKGMINDITDGVKKLIADGIADPKRICIVGASYGGYAALAGATFTPDLYACAVSYAGVADLQELFAYDMRASANSEMTSDDLQRLLGAGFHDGDALAAISPAMHAAQVRAPVLLIHAEKDVTVPINQSQEELQALQKAGRQAQLVQIPGDDHYLSTSQSRIEVLKQIETFLAQNIGH